MYKTIKDIINFSKNSNIYDIYNQIQEQSRDYNLFIKFKIRDSFEGRLNFLILHLSLIMFFLNSHGKSGKNISNKLIKILLFEIDASLREKGLGDKIIERKVLEMKNSLLSKSQIYKRALINNDYLKKVVAKHIYNNSKINIKYINMIVDYIETQKDFLSKVDLLFHKKQKIFIN